MLRTRVITAILLLVGLLSAVFLLPPIGWLFFVAVVAGLGGWEFGRLAGFSGGGMLALGIGVTTVCLVFAGWSPELRSGSTPGLAERATLAVSAVFWLVFAPLWLRRRWPLASPVQAIAVAFVLLVPTWLALVLLRKAGAPMLFAVMALVWVADIAAYFTGRRFGKRKLAPSISPGKTWEGAWGAIAAVLVYGLSLSFFGAPVVTPLWALVFALPVLTLVSIEGDLFESLLKRQAGIKDSSGLLPGHGGILDRIDSLTSTLPIATLLLIP